MQHNFCCYFTDWCSYNSKLETEKGAGTSDDSSDFNGKLITFSKEKWANMKGIWVLAVLGDKVSC